MSTHTEYPRSPSLHGPARLARWALSLLLALVLLVVLLGAMVAAVITGQNVRISPAPYLEQILR